MPAKKGAKNKPKQSSRQQQDVRSSTLQNGLYFYILDCLNNPQYDVEFSEFLNSLGIKLQSTRGSADKRAALFLNLNPEISPEPILPGKKRTGVHISIDRDYLEFEKDQLTNQMAWHYAHYTEEYEDGTVVHIYFNSNGHFVGKLITNRQQVGGQQANESEVAKISVNLTAISDVLLEIMRFKSNFLQKQVSAASDVYEMLLQSARENTDEDDYNSTLKEYNEARLLVARYDDVGLIMPSIRLAEEIAKERLEQAARQSAAATRAASAQAKQADRKKQEALNEEKRKQQEKEKVENARKEFITEQESAESILKLNDLEFLDAQLDLEKIKDSVFSKLALLPEKNKRSALSLLERINSEVNKKIQTIISRQTEPTRVNLEFLQKYFKQFQSFFTTDIYESLIAAATTAKTADEQTRLRNICEYMYSNSTDYCRSIKIACILDEKNNPQAVVWLMKCFENNNLATFEMLLRHGVSLDADALLPQADQHEFALSIFRVLFMSFSGALDNSSQNQAKEVEEKILKFLGIMLKPDFFAGAEYEKNINARLLKQLRLARLAQIKKARRDNSRVKPGRYLVQMPEREKQDGIFGVFEVAIKLGMPETILNLLAANIKAKNINLKMLVILIGKIIQSNNFGLVLNGDDVKIHGFKTLSAIEFEDARDRIESRYDAEAAGKIIPCIYVTPIVDGSDTNTDLTQEQLTLRYTFLSNVQTLFFECLANTEPSDIELYLKKFLSITFTDIKKKYDNMPAGTSANLLNQLVCKEFLDFRYAALVILFSQSDPAESKKLEYYQRIMQCLLDIANLPLSQPEITRVYCYHIARLLAETEKLSSPDINKALEQQVVKTHGNVWLQELKTDFNQTVTKRAQPTNRA